ncbi:Stonustoxin subunit beta [Dissostichus eleginoides]|uniref:Stonustoxin subunit beta n=1 Tax=Dissostichus eleginoides TaxID=100907 RepID=A0AAD9BCF4_DISEL|nr:Stonustoxin subunit beta [Dissostichus eleginoides]
MASEGSGTMEVAALGRPFGLGMLYDCRNDSLVPGALLDDLQVLFDFSMETSTLVDSRCDVKCPSWLSLPAAKPSHQGYFGR